MKELHVMLRAHVLLLGFLYVWYLLWNNMTPSHMDIDGI